MFDFLLLSLVYPKTTKRAAVFALVNINHFIQYSSMIEKWLEAISEVISFPAFEIASFCFYRSVLKEDAGRPESL